MFFTDGKLYCFQLSSWKIKAQADKEVTRLKSLGYSALVQEASIPKMGKWYRVRIGYFNSLQEAADYKKKMKKQLRVSA